MKVVILAGGFGTRICEESHLKPKPMLEIGGKPILWHIMKEYSFYGFRDFIICAGYKQHVIKEWFADYYLHNSDITFDFTDNGAMTVLRKEDWEQMYKFAEATMERYRKEAALIVTSKYHAALIALALGIPVILVMENNYYKYSWVEKFIPVYEPKDFDNIDWHPQKVVIPKDEKELMLRIAKKRILETYEKYFDICTLSELRERSDLDQFEDIFYGAFAVEWIKKNWDKNLEIAYGLWGVTDTSIRLNRFIYKNYPNARLKKVYDWSVRNPVCYAEGMFVPVSLEELESEEGMELFIFVTGNSASQAAEELFSRLQKKNFFLCERKILAESDVIR